MVCGLLRAGFGSTPVHRAGPPYLLFASVVMAPPVYPSSEVPDGVPRLVAGKGLKFRVKKALQILENVQVLIFQ